MTHKSKALGPAVLAVVAITALGGGNAAATTSGHFVSESTHTLVESVSNLQHSHSFKSHSGEIACTSLKHEGTFVNTTVTSIELTPTYTGCKTEAGEGPEISGYTYNGCVFRITSAAAAAEQTLHFVCPAGKALEFHQVNCLATMPSQTAAKAATSKTITVNGKNAITMELHATFETQYHGGLCVFLGTKQSATLSGTAVLNAYDTNLQRVSLSVT